MTSSTPTFFATPAQFRSWLKRHHRSAPELLVGFYKKDSGKPSITWPEAVDEALCCGWIDGVRKRIDEVSYSIRFTPRRPVSTWSAINIKRVAVLKAAKRMLPAGLEAFKRRSEDKSRIYFYEQRHDLSLSDAHQRKLEANRKAWDFYQLQPLSYRQFMIYWIVSAKKEETRLRRLEVLIAASLAGRRL